MIKFATLSMFCAAALSATEYQLLSEARVGGRGVFLDELFTTNSPLAPAVLVASAPAVGRPVFLTREQVKQALAKAQPGSPAVSGPDRIRLVRKSRLFAESDLKELVTSTLAREHLHDRGELEIRFNRAWAPVTIPDEPLSLKVLDLPSGGISPSFIFRAEVYACNELLGSWHIPLQARIWKEVWVTRAPVLRGQLFREADVARERRDVLALRDAISVAPADGAVEFAESLPAGQPLLARSLKLRPVVKRGRKIEALLQDDGLNISLKVEALEDGVAGQIVRVRNLQSRREFRGKVQDEQTVLVRL